MQVELIFDIIYIVHQILHLPAYSLSPSRHRIYPNFQTTFHMLRNSSFKPWFISVEKSECIIVLTEEVDNILYPRTPVWFKETWPSIVIIKAGFNIPLILTSERSTFNFLIYWIIIIIITQYLSHYHFHCHRCSYDNYFYKLKFYFTIIAFITSCISFFFFILIQKIQCEWCGYPSCWLPTIVRFLSHGKFWVWRWRMDASHEDWRQKGPYFH